MMCVLHVDFLEPVLVVMVVLDPVGVAVGVVVIMPRKTRTSTARCYYPLYSLGWRFYSTGLGFCTWLVHSFF